MSISDRLTKSSCQRSVVNNNNSSSGGLGARATAAEAAMPRQPLRATSAAAAAAAAAAATTAAAASGDSNEPIRPTFCTPIRPVIAEPSPEDSDTSLRTARCVSDRISRDSLVDVIFNMKDVAKQDGHCSQQRRKQHGSMDGGNGRDSGGRQPETSGRSSDDRTHFREKNKVQVAESKRWRSDAESGRSIRDKERDRQLTTLNEQDTSELIQMLIGRAFGSDCQKVRSLRKTVDATSVSISANCGGGGSTDNREVQFDSTTDAATIAAAAEQSEMMTLTCGDLSKTFMTHLQAPHGVDAAISTNTANATVAEATTVRTRRKSNAARDNHRLNNCSSVSLNRSEVATATGIPATNASNEEVIPPSDRLGGKSAISDGASGGDCGSCECGGIDKQKGNDVTVESTVVVDFDDYVSDVIGSAGGGGRRRVGGCDDCSLRGSEVCTCDFEHRRNRKTRNRFGRLRTPEICKRTLSRSTSGTTIATTTAAEAEWDEANAVLTSMSERHRIDTSEDSEDTHVSLKSQWKRRKDRASPRQRTVRQEAEKQTAEKPRKKKPQKSREKLSAASSPQEKQQKQKKKKKKPLRKRSVES